MLHLILADQRWLKNQPISQSMTLMQSLRPQTFKLTPLLTLCLSTSTNSLSKAAPLKDAFLQPIEPPSLLKEFPDYEVVAKGDGNKQAVAQQDRFAVIQFGAHQFKVTPEDKIYLEKVRHLDVNSEIHLKKVLVWASRDDTVVGRPYVNGAFVHALVEVCQS